MAKRDNVSGIRQNNSMAMSTMNVGARIIFGYILSAIMIALSTYQACVFKNEGNTKQMIFYFLLAAFGAGYALLVTFNLYRCVKKQNKNL